MMTGRFWMTARSYSDPVIVAHRVVQHEHAVALYRGQAQVQAGPPKQRSKLGLEALEPGARDDWLFVDQVALERGQHLLVGHVDGLERHEAAQGDCLRGHEVAELVEFDVAALELPPHDVGELRRGSVELHVHEAPVEVQAEVPLQGGGRVLRREDHRDLDAEIDPVRALEDQLVGEEKLCGREPLLVQVHAAAERTVVVHERAAE
jgi:hypothetical protein